MTIFTKSLLALALTTFVAQAHPISLTPPSSVAEVSPENLEAALTWNTVNTYEETVPPAEAIFRTALPWQPETLLFSDVYSPSSNLETSPEIVSVPAWITPVYDRYIVGVNMFAPSTYWFAGSCLLLLALLPGLRRALPATRSSTKKGASAKKICVMCDSREIRRVPLGNGISGEICRSIGLRAFRCGACNSKFFRRWEYEGSETATRARAS